MVIGPEGKPISETLQEEEGLLYADIDLSRSVAPKQLHDVVGSYNRFDIFRLSVDRSSRLPVNFELAHPSSEPNEADPGDESGPGISRSTE